MNHEEKLYNSFRIAKSDILESQKKISELNGRIADLAEAFTILQADYSWLTGNNAVQNLHVVPRSDGWAIISSGKDYKTHRKKSDAVLAASKMAKNKSSCLIVHDKNGNVAVKDYSG